MDWLEGESIWTLDSLEPRRISPSYSENFWSDSTPTWTWVTALTESMEDWTYKSGFDFSDTKTVEPEIYFMLDLCTLSLEIKFNWVLIDFPDDEAHFCFALASFKIFSGPETREYLRVFLIGGGLKPPLFRCGVARWKNNSHKDYKSLFTARINL